MDYWGNDCEDMEVPEEVVDENFEEIPEYDVEDLPEEVLELKEEAEDLEVPWKEDIEDIDDPEILEKEIETAEKYQELEKDLSEKVDAGEISVAEYDSRLRPQRNRNSTRCALETVGLTYDDLGDLSEDYDTLVTGDLEAMEAKENLRKDIDLAGEEISERMADRMLDDEKINEREHGSLTRLGRLAGK